YRTQALVTPVSILADLGRHRARAVVEQPSAAETVGSDVRRIRYASVLASGALASLCCFFFFFQAEDGIRDYKVTGVQTCALPISDAQLSRLEPLQGQRRGYVFPSRSLATTVAMRFCRDRKSTRLNSSHLVISYAVFCLKKKKYIRHGSITYFSTVALFTPHLHSVA